MNYYAGLTFYHLVLPRVASWTPKNIIPWDFNQISNIFCEEIVFLKRYAIFGPGLNVLKFPPDAILSWLLSHRMLKLSFVQLSVVGPLGLGI